MHELCLVAAEPVGVDAFGSYCIFLFAYISIGYFFLYIMVKNAIDDRKWKVQETLRGANRLLTEEMRESFRQLTKEMREKYLAMVKVPPATVNKEGFDSEIVALKQRLKDLENQANSAE
jgi:F0F1-type ATP synthase membrane subunit b/b'